MCATWHVRHRAGYTQYLRSFRRGFFHHSVRKSNSSLTELIGLIRSNQIDGFNSGFKKYSTDRFTALKFQKVGWILLDVGHPGEPSTFLSIFSCHPGLISTPALSHGPFSIGSSIFQTGEPCSLCRRRCLRSDAGLIAAWGF